MTTPLATEIAPAQSGIWKTLFSLLILALAWFINDLCLAWVHERVPYQSDPLPDIWFSFFQEYTEAIKVTEILLIFSLFCTFALIFLHRHRGIILRRVFFVAALCYFGRALCIAVTQVPVPSRRTYCAPRSSDNKTLIYLWKRVGWTFSGFGMDTINKPRELCGDLIYSGHTIVLFLCYLIFSEYAPKKIKWFGHVSGIIACMGVVGILMARKHYTLDVLLAYYFTTRIFWIYHTMANNKNIFLNLNGIRNIFWAAVVRFLEEDVPLKLDNEFDLPLKNVFQEVGSLIKSIVTISAPQKCEFREAIENIV